MTNKRSRANGEGSIFPYKNGFAAYAWVDRPDGTRTRKYVYGKTREEVHDKWVDLLKQARSGPVATKALSLADFLRYWLREIVEPNLAPPTASTYETMVRLYIELASARRVCPGSGPATFRSGSTGFAGHVSAASRARTPGGPRASGAAVRLADAAGRRSPPGRFAIFGRCCGRLLAKQSARISSAGTWRRRSRSHRPGLGRRWRGRAMRLAVSRNPPGTTEMHSTRRMFWFSPSDSAKANCSD